jgi:hypothetical protein
MKLSYSILSIISVAICVLCQSSPLYGASKNEYQSHPENKKRPPEYHYSYIDREHTFNERLRQISFVYAASWALYPLTQPKVFKEQGSVNNYRRNFGKIVFDKDEPFWNWIIHPISGSQLYLLYRANGHSRSNALLMTFISSTLFEFTIEIYTEPASVQDLYQTPIWGSFIGVGLESLSMYLLNTGNNFGRFMGHLLNPSTLFNFYEGKVRISPMTDFKSNNGIFVTVDF